LIIDVFWVTIFILGSLAYISLRTLRKRTRLLHVEGRHDAEEITLPLPGEKGSSQYFPCLCVFCEVPVMALWHLQQKAAADGMAAAIGIVINAVTALLFESRIQIHNLHVWDRFFRVLMWL